MKICLALYRERITTLLENTSFFRLYNYDVTSGELVEAGEILLSRECSHISRIQAIVTARIDVLICGGLSKANRTIFSNYGIQVFDWICGNSKQVLQAWKENDLQNYLMPGCRQQEER